MNVSVPTHCWALPVEPMFTHLMLPSGAATTMREVCPL